MWRLFKTSAKTQENVDKTFHFIFDLCAEAKEAIENSEPLIENIDGSE